MNIKVKKELRSFVLVFTTPLRRFCLCSAVVLTLAGGAAGTLWSRAKFICGGHSSVTLTPVWFSVGTFLPQLFQDVSPVCLLCSRRIALPSCALIVGSSSGFPMGLVWAGGTPLPLPPLPDCQSLWGVVTHNYHPHVGTIWYKIVGWCFDLYHEDDKM